MRGRRCFGRPRKVKRQCKGAGLLFIETERVFRTNLQTPGLLYVMTVLGYKKGELDRPIFVTPKTTHSRDWAMLWFMMRVLYLRWMPPSSSRSQSGHKDADEWNKLHLRTVQGIPLLGTTQQTVLITETDCWGMYILKFLSVLDICVQNMRDILQITITLQWAKFECKF